MVPMSALWLSVLISAVIVFIASSILHMVLAFHKNDCRQLPQEERVLETLRAAGVTPGRMYMFPYCSHKEMRSPESVEKFKRGPVGMMTVIPSGTPAMGKFLTLWFLYSLLVGALVACLTAHTMSPGAQFLEVFRVAAVAAFLGYAVGNIPDSIWKGQPWSVTLKHMFDGVIYALLTAATFGFLWPK
jgi:hypothetical protein